MKFAELFEVINIALDALRSNKTRSFLASLGVVIGISFVILMGWALSGLDNAMEETFKIMGTDVMYVDKFDWAGGKNWKELQNRKNITVDQAFQFIDKMKEAEVVVPMARKFGALVKYETIELQNLSITGTRNEFSKTPSGAISEGRFFNPFEDERAENVAVLGTKPIGALFADSAAVGKTIKIGGHNFLVIGTITKQGSTLMDFVDNVIYIPMRTFFKVFGSYNRSMYMCVKAGSEDKMDAVREEARGAMRTIRNLKPGDKDDFSINETKAFESSVSTIRTVVWSTGIGMTVLSFIVGIIGIMNIMFVSVTERTKEIGIRKAIGAKKRTILVQFIVESSALCLLGAFISFILTSILVYLVATFIPNFYPQANFLAPVIPFNLLIIASIVSIVVGILAGLIPAWKAANLDPIDALRYE